MDLIGADPYRPIFPLPVLIGVLKTADQTWPIRWHKICENDQRRFNRGASQRSKCAWRGPAECRGPRGDPHAPSGVSVPPSWITGSTQPTLTCLCTYRLMLTVNAFDREHARVLIKLAEGFTWHNIRFCKVIGKNHVKQHPFFKIRWRQIIH